VRFTCLDAAEQIGITLRGFGGVVFASATPGPPEVFAAACGLVTNPTSAPSVVATFGKCRSGFTPDTSGVNPDLRWQSANGATTEPSLVALAAHTPWREGAYAVAYDVRVDTAFRQRARHHATTAATVAALCEAAAQHSGSGLSVLDSGLTVIRCIAVFFPSYAYADAIEQELVREFPALRVARQPRAGGLAAQTAWVEESLALADALFLVLGSSFAEGIDLLGGRVTHAMVVGPALPEINAVQSARLAALERAGLTREAAFERVGQIPGIARVNQALGRLVRAPGQHAKVLLHCRRFIEPAYARLLDPDYQFGATINNDDELAAWLGN
jgi:DNA excision repair protein ERCC-2